MANIAITPPPGLFTDDTNFSGGPRWVAGNNVRFWQGAPQVIGGWVKRIASQITSTGNAILEWKTNASIAHVAYGGSTSLHVEKTGALFDITPAGVFSGSAWTLANYGETLIANISGLKTYQWSLNTAAVAVQVTNAPVNATTILVTPERQLLALGCNEEVSGTFNPRCIRGSDIEDITNWTTTATNNVFEHILDGASSGIVAAQMVGPYVAVWTSTELFIGQFVGDPGQTYRFEKVASRCGAIGRRAVTVIDGRAYWLTPDVQFRSWAPGEMPNIVPCPIINQFRSQVALLSATEKLAIEACHVAQFDEVWFLCGRVTPPLFSGSYVAFSLIDNSWFKGAVQRRAMHQGLSNLIAIDQTGSVTNCETGQFGSALTSATLEWSLETSAFYLDEAESRVMVRRAKPDFKSQAGNVSMTIKTREEPQGLETTQASQTFALGTTRTDFRFSGRLFRVVLSGNDGPGSDAPTFARFGKLLFDIVRLGRR